MKFCFLGSGPHSLATICRLVDLGLDDKLQIIVLDRKDCFDWHPGLLVPKVTMQISFLKDLVSQINPRSQFSFLNFLSETGRLTEFTNLSTLYPYRIEFRNYLRWVVDRLEKIGIQFIYAASVVEVGVLDDGRCNIALSSGESLVADYLQISIGGAPNIPNWSLDMLPSRRITHSEKFLMRIEEKDMVLRDSLHFCIVGGGQSAIEMLNALREKFPRCEIDLIMRRSYLQEYTTNKFSNRIFLPSHIESFFSLPRRVKEALHDEYRLTNYSGVNSSDLDELYRTMYFEKILGSDNIKIHPKSEVVACEDYADRCKLSVRDLLRGEITQREFDYVFLGTGYENSLQHALTRIGFCDRSENIYVDECFQMIVDNSLSRIFCMGHNELSHGIQDVLVSNVAFKADKVCKRLTEFITD